MFIIIDHLEAILRFQCTLNCEIKKCIMHVIHEILNSKPINMLSLLPPCVFFKSKIPDTKNREKRRNKFGALNFDPHSVQNRRE